MSPEADTPLDYLQRSIRELREKERELNADMERLQKVRDQLREQATRLEAAMLAFQNARTNDFQEERPPTIQAGVLRVLATAPNGLPALRILDELKSRFGMEYPRTSLSPQLSRLKTRGQIKLRGNIWSLTEE